jgi:hypothetical protein
LFLVSFSTATAEQLRVGMQRLAGVVREHTAHARLQGELRQRQQEQKEAEQRRAASERYYQETQQRLAEQRRARAAAGQEEPPELASALFQLAGSVASAIRSRL